MRKTLSVAIITRNEEANLERTLGSALRLGLPQRVLKLREEVEELRRRLDEVLN